MTSKVSRLERFVVSLIRLIKKYGDPNISNSGLEQEEKRILSEVKRFPELSSIVRNTLDIRKNQGEKDLEAFFKRKGIWRDLNISYFIPNGIYVFYKREGLYAYKIHSHRRINVDSREVTIYFLTVLYVVSPLSKISGFYYKDHILINYSGISEHTKQIAKEINQPDKEFPERSAIFKKIFSNLSSKQIFDRLLREYLYHEITHQVNASLLSKFKKEGQTPIPAAALKPGGDFYWRVVDEIGAYLGQIAISYNPKFVILSSLLPDIHSWSPSIEYGDTSRIIVEHLFNKFKKYCWFESSYLSDVNFVDSLKDEEIKKAAKGLFEETFNNSLPAKTLLEEALKKTVYRIGSSTHSPEEFLALFKYYGIRCLIDLRRFPTNEREHFKEKRLDRLLQAEGITYIYLGSKIARYRNPTYEGYVKNNNYLKELEKIESIAERTSSAIMCGESFPRHLHCDFISQRLKERKWEVINVMESDRGWRT